MRDAVVERAQLFERFGAFERGRRQRGEAQQRVAPVDVQADCRHAGAGGQPSRVNGIGAREKYSAKPSPSTTTFMMFGLCRSASSSIRLRSVLISSAGIGGERRDRFVDHLRRRSAARLPGR